MGFEKLRHQYINFLKETIKKNEYEKIYIYGTGKYGKSLYRLLKDRLEAISGFIVTDVKFNMKSLYGLPVIGIRSLLQQDENVLFLIGVKKKWSRDIIATLREEGYFNYIDVSEKIGYLCDFVNKFERPSIEITPRIGCNIDCKYCPQELLYKQYFSEKNKKILMSFFEFKKYIDKTPKNLVVDFAGFVEPFLNNEVEKMMKYSAEIGRDISLYTTLVGCTVEMFHEIKKIPFYEVVLHLPDKDGYAKIPMTKQYFEVLELAINSVKPDGSLFIDQANCQSEPHPDVLEYTNGRVTISSDLTDRAGVLEDSGLAGRRDIKGEISCGRAKNMDHFVLLPDGSLVLCCNDFGLQHVVGNLNSQTFEEIIMGETFHKIKQKMKSEVYGHVICRDCIYAITI